jgi:hypothetical protein
MGKRPRIRKEVLWSLIIVFIMVFSAFGVIFYGFATPGTKLQYGVYKFTLTDQGFVTTVNGKKYVFDHYPADIENVNLSAGVVEKMKGTRMVYLTYDPNQSAVGDIAASQFKLQSELQTIGIYSATALTAPNEYELPVVTCQNATPFVPVVDFRESNRTAVDLEGNCIVFDAVYGEDFSRLKDRLLYALLGVMK